MGEELAGDGGGRRRRDITGLYMNRTGSDWHFTPLHVHARHMHKHDDKSSSV